MSQNRRRLRMERLEARKFLSITVNTLLDENDGIADGEISLRDAVAAAAVNDTINFAPALTSSGPATIALTLGQIVLNKGVTIDGPGAQLLTVDASGSDPTPNTNNGDGTRIFSIQTTAYGLPWVRILGITLTGGDVTGDGGAIRAYDTGPIELADVVITGNAATASGGGFRFRSFNEVKLSRSLFRENFSENGGGVFAHAMQNANVTIQHCTVSNNSAVKTAGGIYAQGLGGKVTIQDSVVSGNLAGTNGGGIWAKSNNGGGTLGGLVSVVQSTITDNSAVDGGGIWAWSERQNSGIVVSRSEISGNSSTKGGGIYARAHLANVAIRESTISGNTALNQGGGIWFSVENDFGSAAVLAHVINCTISGNTANEGGGIWCYETTISGFAAGLFVQFSTLTNNTADASGGGLFLPPNSGEAYLRDSIIAGNRKADNSLDDIKGTINAQGLGHNLIGDGTGISGGIRNSKDDLVGTMTLPIDPKLGPLNANGGKLRTHALLAGSPAINMGNPNAVAGQNGVPEFDQRQAPFSRISAGRIDIGAFERQPGGSQSSLVDVQTSEGNSGETLVGLLVTLSAPAPAGSWISVKTVNGTATIEDDDYVLRDEAPYFYFEEDATSAMIPLVVHGDLRHESDETFEVAFVAAGGVGVLDGLATVTILNDDSPPIPGDSDYDSDVDGSDFLSWQRGLGSTGTAATVAAGNADGDDDVDGNDLEVWKLQFGEPNAAMAVAASDVFTANAVPTTGVSRERHAASSAGARKSACDAVFTVAEVTSLDADLYSPLPPSKLRLRQRRR